MTPIVADTGPLIALARAGRLGFLRRLYRHVVIPLAVHGELEVRSGRPGATALAGALAAGWTSVRSAANQKAVLELGQLLDLGEGRNCCGRAI